MAAIVGTRLHTHLSISLACGAPGVIDHVHDIRHIITQWLSYHGRLATMFHCIFSYHGFRHGIS